MQIYPKLNERQQEIVNFIKKEKTLQIGDVLGLIEKKFGVKRLTLVRDLSFLAKNNILDKHGKGRSISYSISQQYLALEKINVEEYFSRPFSEREASPVFKDEIFSILNDNLFSEEEIEMLEKANGKYIETRNKLAKDSPAIFRKEWERLIIELSWKSSEIEGNTYTLLETEMLLREMHFAKGKDKSEAQMLLNHKKTLDFILTNDDYFKDITLDKIIKIHEFLTEKIDIKKDFRDHPVGITGTIYRPIPKKKEIEVIMKKLVEALEKVENPFTKSFIVLVMIAYIQPFEDGNKRTSRIIANAILHAYSKSMLSYRDVNTIEYKKAMILFYEQNNVSYIKEIFMQQFEFAVENYFG
ncbi:MAG: Fic family protein [Candidatus Moranbacteria bacterium GW2011_GWA2_39_41]|nr:MAG: Fic family protein [Candidatus Moranbacteria bacterium GW2011_GWA2_39_41]